MEPTKNRYLLHVTYEHNMTRQPLAEQTLLSLHPTFQEAILSLLSLPPEQFHLVASREWNHGKTVSSAVLMDLASGYVLANVATLQSAQTKGDTIQLQFGGGVMGIYFPAMFDASKGEPDQDKPKIVPLYRMERPHSFFSPTEQGRYLSESIRAHFAVFNANIHPSQWVVGFVGTSTEIFIGTDQAIRPVKVHELHGYENEKEALLRLLSTPAYLFDKYTTNYPPVIYERAYLTHVEKGKSGVNISVTDPNASTPSERLSGRFLVAEQGLGEMLQKLKVPAAKGLDGFAPEKVIKLDTWSAGKPPNLIPTFVSNKLVDALYPLQERQNRLPHYITQIHHVPNLSLINATTAHITKADTTNYYHLADLGSALFALFEKGWEYFDEKRVKADGLGSLLTDCKITDGQGTVFFELRMQHPDQGWQDDPGLFAYFGRGLLKFDAFDQLHLRDVITHNLVMAATPHLNERIKLVRYEGDRAEPTPLFARMQEALHNYNFLRQVSLRPEIVAMHQQKENEPYFLEMRWGHVGTAATDPSDNRLIYRIAYSDINDAMNIFSRVPPVLFSPTAQKDEHIPLYLLQASLVCRDGARTLLTKNINGQDGALQVKWMEQLATPNERVAYHHWFSEQQTAQRRSQQPGIDRDQNDPQHDPPPGTRPRR